MLRDTSRFGEANRAYCAGDPIIDRLLRRSLRRRQTAKWLAASERTWVGRMSTIPDDESLSS